MSFNEVRCVAPPMMTASIGAPGAAHNVTTANVSGGAANDTLANWTWRSVPVCVSLNGDPGACATGEGGTALNFSYYNPSVVGIVSRVYPSAGSVAGGTLVTLWGSGFRDADTAHVEGGLRCVFGDEVGALRLVRAVVIPAIASDDDDGERMQLRSGGNSSVKNGNKSNSSGDIDASRAPEAMVSNDESVALRCLTPPLEEHDDDELPTSVAVRVVMNSDPAAVPHSMGSVRFTYYHL
jgi:hypothetical protein